MKSTTLILLSFSVSLLASCLKVKDYPPTPAIEVINAQITPDSSVMVTLKFTDGDGDLGLNAGDTLGHFDPDSLFYNNLLVRYYELENGTWMDKLSYGYRFDRIDPKGKIKALEGEMDVKMFYDSRSANDTFKLAIQMVDRALNVSNTSETHPVIK